MPGGALPETPAPLSQDTISAAGDVIVPPFRQSRRRAKAPCLQCGRVALVQGGPRRGQLVWLLLAAGGGGRLRPTWAGVLPAAEAPPRLGQRQPAPPAAAERQSFRVPSRPRPSCRPGHLRRPAAARRTSNAVSTKAAPAGRMAGPAKQEAKPARLTEPGGHRLGLGQGGALRPGAIAFLCRHSRHCADAHCALRPAGAILQHPRESAESRRSQLRSTRRHRAPFPLIVRFVFLPPRAMDHVPTWRRKVTAEFPEVAASGARLTSSFIRLHGRHGCSSAAMTGGQA